MNQSQINFPVLLMAIAMVESGNDDAAISYDKQYRRVVARGRYQITAPLWKQYSALPWDIHAHKHLDALEVALQHIKHCEKALSKAKGKPADVALLAYAWRYGLNAAQLANPSEIYDNDYTERAGNLYEFYSKQPL